MNHTDIARIAELSRLTIAEQDMDTVAAQFDRILDYISVINALPMDGVEPQIAVNNMDNVLREDVVGDTVPTADALANAPKKNEAFFKVPKVLG